MTGHAELQLTLSLSLGICLFFFLYDPTTLNKQGPDVGTQYRSVIFNNDDEKKVAESVVDELNKNLMTQLLLKYVKASDYYVAEEYHQKYILKII